MDDNENALLKSGTSLPARTSRLAVVSVAAAFATLFAMFGSAILLSVGIEQGARYVSFFQLLFPLAIVCGHLAVRRIAANPARLKGRTLALLGLMVGYFNLLIVVTIVYLMATQSG